MSAWMEERTLNDTEAKVPGTDLIVKEPAFLARRDEGSREIEFQSLWFTLARMPWRSLVIVPAGEGGSAAAVATALADVGRRLRTIPVTFLVMAGPLDYASAGKIVASVAKPPGEDPGNTGPYGRVIVAIPAVVTEPLGIAVTDAADAVVLCVER